MIVRGVLTILVLLLPMTPPTLADTNCVEAIAAEACVTVDESSSEECSSEQGITGCWSREGQQMEVQLYANYAGAWAEVEHERRTQSYHAEVGACTTLDLTEERESVETSAAGGALLGGAQSWTYTHHANGTVVYEDPCGENLIPDLEPGTYEYRVTQMGGVALMQLPQGTVLVYVVGSEGTIEDEDGNTADCIRSAQGLIMIMSPLGPPIILQPETGNAC